MQEKRVGLVEDPPGWEWLLTPVFLMSGDNPTRTEEPGHMSTISGESQDDLATKQQ